jgi:hypothetical protein
MTLEELLVEHKGPDDCPLWYDRCWCWTEEKADEMARRLKALSERHQKHPSGERCWCGHSLPCPDAEILEGKR